MLLNLLFSLAIGRDIWKSVSVPALVVGFVFDVFSQEDSVLQEQWVREFGPTLKFHGYVLISAQLTQLYTTDTKALNHFLTNSYIYQKAELSRYFLSRIVGPGVLVAEGDAHRQQVERMTNPAFGAPQVRELTEIFVQKSVELRDIWSSQMAESGIARVDVLAWLSKATLDMIGLAGFNYKFNSLASEDQTELAAAFATTVETGQEMVPLRILQAWVPAFRFLSKLDRALEKPQAVMQRIGLRLIQESKDEMAQSGTFEKGRSRDLLSLLVRANTAKDLPASQRLSDEDVLAQVPTFLVAGHETTATTWALFALTQNLAAQTRLRNELLEVGTDEPTMDELNSLQYLDWRVATQDDIVPLNKPFTDIHGNVHETISAIPILAVNRDPAIWGPDSTEFMYVGTLESEISTPIPGIWGHMLSFLGGPRACIGYRFSLIEMKALLFILVRAFEFELAVPIADIQKKTAIVQRPMVRSEPAAGDQMPLIIKPYICS
ncbi:cytochrome P450 [Mycena olivaceomarginata]|nr:cytochrome P450 [Mycena olivaceomarginata]